MEIQVLALPVLSSMLISFAVLAVIFLILAKLLYKPVLKFIEDRKEIISKDINSAKTMEKEAEDLKASYEEKITGAKAESLEIIEGARKRAEELKENILKEARQEAAEIVERGRREANRQKEAALEEVKSQTGEMAILIASKIMEEELNKDKHVKLIDQFIDEVGSSKWEN